MPGNSEHRLPTHHLLEIVGTQKRKLQAGLNLKGLWLAHLPTLPGTPRLSSSDGDTAEGMGGRPRDLDMGPLLSPQSSPGLQRWL